MFEISVIFLEHVVIVRHMCILQFIGKCSVARSRAFFDYFVSLLPNFIRANEEASRDHWNFDVLDYSMHVTVSADYSVHGDNAKTDMSIHVDGPAPWSTEETNGGRLVGVYSAEISLEEEEKFKKSVDDNWCLAPPLVCAEST